MAGTTVVLPQTRINYLSSQALPASLDVLSRRHESLLQVIHYLEGNYLLAAHNKADRSPIEKEAKLYLNEALTRVAADIDTAAACLEQYLSLEATAVDSLTQQVSSLQSRMLLSKEQGARARLEAFVKATPTVAAASSSSSGGAAAQEAVFSSRVLPLPADSRRMSLQQHAPAKKAAARVPLSARLSRLDAVGMPLSMGGETSIPPVAASLSVAGGSQAAGSQAASSEARRKTKRAMVP